MSEQEKRVQGQGPELVPDLALAEFELQLARAMRRADAPVGFAARVMERAAIPSESAEAAQKLVVMRSRFGMARMQAWAGGAIAATLALGMFGAEQVHQRHVREVQTALANQQFAMATRITDQVLERTREQLARAGVLNDVE
jgi:hypothetical protein